MKLGRRIPWRYLGAFGKQATLAEVVLVLACGIKSLPDFAAS